MPLPSLAIIPPFLAVLAIFVLGIAVYYNNPKSATNRTMLVFSLVFIFWNISNFLVSQPLPQSSAIWMLRLLVFSAVWLVFYLFQFFYVFPRDRVVFPKWFRLGLFPAALLTSILTLTPLVFARVTLYSAEGKIQTAANGPGIAVFGLMVVGLIAGSIYLLLKHLLGAEGIRRAQLQYILLGTVMTFCLFIVFNFILPAFFGNPEFLSFGAIFALPFIGLTAYAIVKHRFLDIRLVVARAVSYTFLIGVFAVFYAVPFAFLSSLLVRSEMAYRTVAISTLLALIMIFSFQSIRRFLEKASDKILYKEHYDVNEVLYRLALIMASTLRLEELTRKFLINLLREVKITRGAFILVDENRIFRIVDEGFRTALEIDQQEIALMLGWTKTLIFEEIPQGTESDLLRKLGFNLVTPLTAEGKYIGILALGEKQSGELYSSEDVKVVEILAPEAAVAIQNAKAYEEIERFNITLKEEVNKATADLKVANTRLKELDKLKDDFVSITSHELRTPMTAIKSYLWMALKRPDIELSEKMTKYIYRSYISTERLINLVNDMLNVSRIEAGRIEIKPVVFDIQALAGDTASEVTAKAAERKVIVNVASSHVPQVFADQDKVHEVLLNLVGNSLKFTPEGGKIDISFFTDGKVVETSVKDSGVGISPDDLSRLFKKFERLDNSYIAAATSGGTGLGLYISKSLVELMGGKIWARSEGVSKGATFTFSLPVATREVLAQAEKFTKKPVGEAKGLEPVAI